MKNLRKPEIRTPKHFGNTIGNTFPVNSVGENTIEDVFNRFLLSSDPFISSKMKSCKKKIQQMSQTALDLLILTQKENDNGDEDDEDEDYFNELYDD